VNRDPNMHQRRESNRERNWVVNWGKSFPAGRGKVEYVSLKLDYPRDVTLYLGQPNTQMFGYININPFEVNVGSGGTSFLYPLGTEFSADESVRGNVLHFVTDELYVRGMTNLPPTLAPGDDGASIRFAVQAGLGRPSNYDRQQWQLKTMSGGSIENRPLNAWATHAWLSMFSSASGAPPALGDALVEQINEGPLGSTTLMAAEDATAWLQPHVLHPWCNTIQVTTSATFACQWIVNERFQH
jgi:hypothetical protein